MTATCTRLFTLLGLTVLLAASFPVAASDSPPPVDPLAIGEIQTVREPQPTGQCITCVGSYATNVHWGVGANCSASLQDLQNQVNAAANSFCAGISFWGTCNSTLIITTQCWYKAMTGEYVTDGYLLHGCLEGDYFCPEW